MHTHDLSEWTHDHLFDEGNHAAERVRQQLSEHEEIVHATVEIQRCRE